MDHIGVVEELLKQQYKSICDKLAEEEAGKDIMGDTEVAAYRAIMGKKQQLMLDVHQGVGDIHVISVEAWQEMATNLRIALQAAFEEAKVVYRPLLEQDVELRAKFLKLADVALPDCANLRSPYMRQNYPTFQQYQKRFKGRKGKEDQGKADAVLEQIKQVAALECLFELYKNVRDAFEDAKKKLRQKLPEEKDSGAAPDERGQSLPE